MSEPETHATDPAPETDTEKSDKKKHKKRSRALRDFERMERHMSRAALQMSQAVTNGLSTYHEEREKSESEDELGALMDLPKNAARGLGVTMREASEVPLEVVEALDSRSARKALRMGAKVIFWPIRR